MNTQCKSLLYLLPIFLAGVGRADIVLNADNFGSIELSNISIETMQTGVVNTSDGSYESDYFMIVKHHSDHYSARHTLRTREMSAVLAEIGTILALDVVRDMPQVPAAVLAAA